MVIVLLIILLTLVYFYLKCPLMASLATLLAMALAAAAAFGFFGTVAQMLISRGYGGAWAMPGAFVVVFVFAFALLRGLADYLIGNAIDLGNIAKTAAAVVCGLLGGILIAGVALVALGMMPVQHKLLYNRFPADSPIVLANPAAPALAADGMVVGFYSWLSRGALAAKHSFAVVQADFLNRMHINRHHIADGVSPIAGRDSLVIPPRGKSPVRLFTTADQGTFAVVRLGVSMQSIVDGGAADENGRVAFFAGQLRLVCKPDGQQDNLLGKGQAVWPAGVFKNGAFVQKRLEEMIDEEKDIVADHNNVRWLDAAFILPPGQAPVAVQFKQNVTQTLVGIRPAATTPEIEQALSDELKDAQ
jgi:hypothetical protein